MTVNEVIIKEYEQRIAMLKFERRYYVNDLARIDETIALAEQKIANLRKTEDKAETGKANGSND